MTQYESSDMIPQQILDIVANKCSLLDRYVLVQTGENQYTALIQDIVSDEVTQLVFTRDTDSGIFTITESLGSWEYTVENEFYCYSNVGLGAALDLPVIDGVQAHAAVAVALVIMFLVVFRTALFPFRRNK